MKRYIIIFKNNITNIANIINIANVANVVNVASVAAAFGLETETGTEVP